MTRVRVVGLAALMATIAACTTSTAASTPSISAIVTNQHTTSTAPPTPSITAILTNQNSSVPLTAARPSSAQQAAGTPAISLSQPPETYSVPQYLLCGQQFGVYQGADLYIYPAVPKAAIPRSDGRYRSLAVALGADCQHGATVKVSPAAAATVQSMVFAGDGNPLVVMVVPHGGKTGVVTFTPASGPPIRTKIG